jgi:hypothetical protein
VSWFAENQDALIGIAAAAFVVCAIVWFARSVR